MASGTATIGGTGLTYSGDQVVAGNAGTSGLAGTFGPLGDAGPGTPAGTAGKDGTDGLSGAPGHAGTAVGADFSGASITTTVPTFTSAAGVSVQAGSALRFAVTANGSPTPAITESGRLPGGVTFSDAGNGTASLAGTPAAAGSYPVTLTATNTQGHATQTFTLTVTAGPAAAIAASSGADQTAAVSTPFATPLAAQVTDAYGNPVSGATVTFSPPTSGPSGSFNAGQNTAVTGPSGVATAAVFTANATPGAYTVNATAAGVTTPASFPLTNTPAGTQVTLQLSGSLTYTGGGPITGSFAVSPTTGPLTSITGTATFPGLHGGNATITIQIRRLFGVLIGTIRITDAGAHLDTTAFVLAPRIARVGADGATGTASGAILVGRRLSPYILVWTITSP